MTEPRRRFFVDIWDDDDPVVRRLCDAIAPEPVDAPEPPQRAEVAPDSTLWPVRPSEESQQRRTRIAQLIGAFAPATHPPDSYLWTCSSDRIRPHPGLARGARTIDVRARLRRARANWDLARLHSAAAADILVNRDPELGDPIWLCALLVATFLQDDLNRAAASLN